MSSYIRYATKLENDVVLEFINRYAKRYLSQLNNLYVSEREFTGSGMYVHFDILNKEIPLVDRESPHLNSLSADVEGVKNGAVFVIFIDDGKINMLEMVSIADENWPPVVNNYKIHEA